MRNRVYLFAAAMIAATSAPALSNEIVIGDTTMIVYEDNYNAAAPDGAYGENYISGAEIVYVDDATAPIEYAVEAPLAYSTESIEQIYSVDGIETAQDVVTMSQTIDGIVYETMGVTQTY